MSADTGFWEEPWLFPNPLAAKCQPGNNVSRQQRAGVTARHFRHRSNIILPLSCGVPPQGGVAGGCKNSLREIPSDNSAPTAGRLSAGTGVGALCFFLHERRNPPFGGERGALSAAKARLRRSAWRRTDKYLYFAPSLSKAQIAAPKISAKRSFPVPAPPRRGVE